MKDIKEKLMENIRADELFKGVQGELSLEEQKKIEETIERFVSSLAAPLVEQFNKIMNSPEAQEELKKRLGKSHT